MTKLSYYLQVGFHLFLIGALVMIASAIIGIPLQLLAGGADAVSGTVIAGFTLLGVVELLIGFMLMGYLVVRWKTWVFKKKWI